MRFQLIAGFLALVFAGCNPGSAEEASSEQNGSLSLRIEAIPVSSELANSAKSLELELVLSSGTDTLRESYTGSVVQKSFSLHPGAWKARIRSLGEGDLPTYDDSMTIQVQSAVSRQIQWQLDARVSELRVVFPVIDSITRMTIYVDGVVRGDTTFAKQALVGRQIPFRVRVAASYAGISHTLSLKVGGVAWGLDTTLYALDTTVVAISGKTPVVPMLLHWVGPSVPPPGQAALLVQVGLPGTISLVASYVDTAPVGFSDPRDGKQYATRWIGRQRWMMANLGDCDSCANNQKSFLPDQMDTLCPSGWHIPDTSEWLRLLRTMAGGGSLTEGLYRIKSRGGWRGVGALAGQWNGDDAIGFGLVPSNFAVQDGAIDFYDWQYFGQYLTSTPGVPYFYIHEDAFEFTATRKSPVPFAFYGNEPESAARCVAD